MRPVFPLSSCKGLLLGLLACALFASADWTELGRPAVKSYGQRDGLPHHTVHHVSRDALGRIWVGTQEGAACYDGRRWVPVPLPPYASSQFVRSIWEDPDGSRWFGTQGAGIWRCRDDRWENHAEAEGLPSLRVHHLLRVPTRGGALWAATDLGPARFQDGAWKTLAEGLPNRWVWKLAWLDVPGLGPALVACTQGGLYALEGDRWVLPDAFRALAGSEINDALDVPSEAGHSLWASVWGKGPGRWEGQAWRFPVAGDGFPGRFPTCLACSRDPRGGTLLWVGTYENGLACLRGGHWQVLNTDRGLRSNGVFAVFPDPRGRPTVWIGMQGGGITALSLEGWVAFLGRASGLPSAGVNCLLELRGGPTRGLVFGTRSGLAWRNQGGWKVQDVRNGLPDSDVRALAEVERDGQRCLFAGTAKGVAHWNGGAWQVEPGLPAEAVNVLLASRKAGRLYAGFQSGLFVLEAKGWSALTPATTNLEPLSLAETAEDAVGSLWVGTRGMGLWRMRGERWQRYDPQPQYPRHSFTALKALAGPDGAPWLWVGTRGDGLLRAAVDTGSPVWQVYGAPGSTDLPHTVVLRIEQDARKRLYLGTTGGIERLQFAADGRSLAQVETFTTGDGLPTTASSLGASLVESNGRIWFGFPEGAAFLDPRDEPDQRPLPSPILQRALVAGQERRIEEGLELGHRDNHLSLDFFLPVFFREEDIRFRSQLLGAETRPGPWRYEGSRDYSGLAPGRYLLKVWARDHRGQVSEPFALPIRIAPPPWASPLALSGYALLLLFLTLAAVQFRTRALRQRELTLRSSVTEATAALRAREGQLLALTVQLELKNDEKNHILGIVAHDLRNPIGAILLQAEYIAEVDPGASGRGAARIAQAARTLISLLERLLDVNRIESGTVLPSSVPLALPHIVADAVDRFTAAAEAKGLALIQEPIEDLPEVLADPSTLAAILDNLLSNAVKFSPPAPPGRDIRIGFQSTRNEAAFWVKDQGPGFSPEEMARAFDRFTRLSTRPTAGESSSGLGLSIVKKLCEALGGRVELESEQGLGATFRVWLPRADTGPESA